jgi:LytS/YehU family sensor histidine kinase
VLLAVVNSFDPESTPTRKGGLGLRNVRQRLETLYGDAANLHVSAENDKFRVELSLPANGTEARQA